MPANCLLFNGIYLGLKDANLGNYQEWIYITYVRLESQDDKMQVESQMQQMLMNAYGFVDWKQFQEEFGMDFRLNSLDETYFSGVYNYDKGNRNLVTIIFWAAIFVLIVALLNYSNFILAQTPSRLRGINTRKVMGASVAGLRADGGRFCANDLHLRHDVPNSPYLLFRLWFQQERDSLYSAL